VNAERALLERLIAGPVSGDAFARENGETRAAVWKRIESLRQAGVEIEARAGRGYALAGPLDLLDPDAIRRAIPPAVDAQLAALEVAWSIDSTNSELLRRGPPHAGVDVLLAERQTGGRGRRGRTWASPLAANLYLSLARSFDGGLARLGGLSLVAGVAAAEALQSLGIAGIRLKWPNDLVVVEGHSLRKLGGLLIEGSGEHAGPVRAVIGLGLNVRMPAAQARRIDQAWIDLATLANGQLPSRNRITAALLATLLPALERFNRDGLSALLPRYAGFDALAGRAITLHGGDGDRSGTAVGLAPDGALRVLMADGEMRSFHAGEVSVRTQ
jgi:BirA family transcriptional regulator, biotin operon repressor / biotin---[acetyl-CoA-carboxylase] ligase